MLQLCEFNLNYYHLFLISFSFFNVISIFHVVYSLLLPCYYHLFIIFRPNTIVKKYPL